MRFSVIPLMLSLLLSPLALAASPPADSVPEPTTFKSQKGHVEIAAAPADKAKVVFFRVSGVFATFGHNIVREGDREIGKLQDKAYFVTELAPGKHDFVAHMIKEDSLTLELEAGKTYYIQQFMQAGVLTNRPQLSLSDAATFNKWVAKYAPSK